jgi:hypothetical protein
VSRKDGEVMWPHTLSPHISEGDLIIITCDEKKSYHIVTEVKRTAPGVQQIAFITDPCE